MQEPSAQPGNPYGRNRRLRTPSTRSIPAIPHSTSRRQLLSGMAMLAASSVVTAVVAASCGQITAPPATAQAVPIKRSSLYTVRVQIADSGPDRALFDAASRDFNAEHTDIQMKTVPAGLEESGDYVQRFEADLAAGTASDLVAFPGRMWHRFAAEGSLHPLDELVLRDKWAATWPASDAYEAQTRFRGKRYLAPMSAAPMVMFFAKEHFDLVGVPYPKPDWTYLDFQDLSRRLTRPFGRQQVFGYQWNIGYLRNMPWWRMSGQLEWDRISDPRKARWNAQPIIEALQYQLYDSQYKLQISPTRQALDEENSVAGFDAGGSAMKMEGPRFLDRMLDPASGEPIRGFDVQMLPRGRASKTPHVAALHGLAMTKMSTDREASWEAIKWLTGENGQRRVAGAGLMCNAPEAARRLWLPAVSRKYTLANAEAFVRALELSTTTFVGELGEDRLLGESGLAAALADIRDGRATAKQALDLAQPGVQQALDAYWARQPDS